MKPFTQALRRPALALAMAGAAALSVTAAAASTGPGGQAAVPHCRTAHLRVWLGIPGEGAAGAVYYELQFSNISSRTCSLFGFPGVSAVNGRGHQLGRAASRDHSYRATTQVLHPRQTVHAVLRITNAGIISGCRPVTAAGLKIYPPNQTKAVVIPFRFRTCSAAHKGNLAVRVVRHGTGIPGYSQ